MIERQALNWKTSAAVLAPEVVAQENVKACESGRPVHGNIVFKRNYTGDWHLERRASNNVIVFRDNVNPALETGLHRILPIPKR